jgi:phosphatidylglycerophosphate synthase
MNAPTPGVVSVLDPIVRPLKDSVLRPMARRLHVLPPALVTLLALLAGLAAAGFLAAGAFAAGLALWFGNRFLDGLDGVVARENGRQTDFGGYLDILADFVVYAAVPLGLVLGMGGRPEQWLALVALLSSFYVNTASWMYLAALLEKRSVGAGARGESTSITMPDALVGGTETVVLFSVFILLPAYLVPLFWLMAGLVGISIVQRLVWARSALTAPVAISATEPLATAEPQGDAVPASVRVIPLPGRTGRVPAEVA